MSGDTSEDTSVRVLILHETELLLGMLQTY